MEIAIMVAYEVFDDFCCHRLVMTREYSNHRTFLEDEDGWEHLPAIRDMRKAVTDLPSALERLFEWKLPESIVLQAEEPLQGRQCKP